MSSLIQYGSLEEAYPDVDPQFTPYGNHILFQLRTPKNMTRGGIHIPQTAQMEDIAQWNTQVARVVKLGPMAYKNRDDLTPWPEGDWCKKGDFVRVPIHGGDRWYLPIPGREDHRALFAIYKDLEVKGQYHGDPLQVDPYL